MKFSLKKLLFFFTPVLFTLFSSELKAQFNKIEFERITSENGLSSDMIISITSDHHGFIWIGTLDGLNKFDGHKIINYRYSEADTTSIANNHILALYRGNDNTIWIFTPYGLNAYDHNADHFIRYDYSKHLKTDYATNEFSDIVEDDKGYLWIVDNRNGLIRFDTKTKEYKKYITDTYRIGAIHFDKVNKTLWIGTLDNELLRYIESMDDFVRVYASASDPGIDPQNQILSIISEPDGSLLIGGSKGIFKYDEQNNLLYPTNIISHRTSSFRNNEVRCLHAESEDILYVGTWGKGLGIYHRKSNNLYNYVVEPNNTTSLSNNDVTTIYKDQSGVIWVGTQDGINIIDPGRGMFEHYQNIPNVSGSLSLNFITSFCEDRSGRIWVGTYGDGINIFDPETKKFTYIRHNPEKSNSLINNAVRAIIEDPEGNIWIGTMRGVTRYNPKTRKFLHFVNDPNDLNTLSGNDILALSNGKNGEIWVGTYGDGLNRIKPVSSENGKYEITRYINEPGNRNSLIINYVRSLHVDKDGIVWIGTIGGGLDQFDPQRNTFVNYTNYPGNSSSLSNKNINCILEDNNGYLWIGTWNGLNRFDRINNNFTVYLSDDGLADQAVSEIQQDGDGNFWISSFKGLSLFRPTENPAFIHFTINHGLQGSKFNINASLKTKDGILYFGGTTGFNVFNPAEIKFNDHIPNLAFTDITVNNKPIPIGKKEKGIVWLKKSITETDEILLYHEAKSIAIHFAALSYSMRMKNQYAYMLEGFDKDWIYTSSKNNVATYSNLKPGLYTLRLKASNSSGMWTDAEKKLLIKVAPPPWKTWWAGIIYFILIGFILYTARNITLSQANLRNNLKLEQLEREKIKEVNDLKLKFFTNVSHEFKTPLTLIVGPLQKLLEGKETNIGHTHEQLRLVERNAKRLLHLVNQLMEFQKVETDNVQLSLKEENLFQVINTVKQSFDELAHEHTIKFEIISNIQHKNIYLDAEKLETILYNLLSNAFKYTRKRGTIQIVIFDPAQKKDIMSFTDETNCINKNMLFSTLIKVPNRDDMISISVIDSGVGINKEFIPRIFERFYKVKKSAPLHHTISHTGTGIGLSLTKSLVDLHHGFIGAESIMNKGTCVTVSLPLNTNYYKEREFAQTIEETDSQEVSEIVLPMPPCYISESEIEVKMNYSDFGLNPENKKSILVVDDNIDIVNFISNNLRSEFLICCATNGEEGFEKAIEKVPDLIISDVMMPVMDGIELCDKIKSDVRTSHIPIILLTAYSSVKHYIAGMENGADDYIPKPFDINLLTLRVRNIVKSREHLHQIFGNEIMVQARKVTCNTMDEKFLKQAIALIEKNLDNPEFNVDTFGQEIGMSRTNLFRKLKALTNKSASEFIRSIKIKKAAQFMLEGYNVSEVSDMVGINSRAYFKKCFMEQFGIGPSEFIKQYVKNQGDGTRIEKTG
jgi:signal transduction histidine kinase/DNA-binding response OmpR family regulator/streptogramin lyase